MTKAFRSRPGWLDTPADRLTARPRSYDRFLDWFEYDDLRVRLDGDVIGARSAATSAGRTSRPAGRVSHGVPLYTDVWRRALLTAGGSTSDRRQGEAVDPGRAVRRGSRPVLPRPGTRAARRRVHAGSNGQRWLDAYVATGGLTTKPPSPRRSGQGRGLALSLESGLRDATRSQPVACRLTCSRAAVTRARLADRDRRPVRRDPRPDAVLRHGDRRDARPSSDNVWSPAVKAGAVGARSSWWYAGRRSDPSRESKTAIDVDAIHGGPACRDPSQPRPTASFLQSSSSSTTRRHEASAPPDGRQSIRLRASRAGQSWRPTRSIGSEASRRQGDRSRFRCIADHWMPGETGIKLGAVSLPRTSPPRSEMRSPIGQQGDFTA